MNTEKGLELFEQKVSEHCKKLSKVKRSIDASISEIDIFESDIDALKKIKQDLHQSYEKYTQLSKDYVEFLERGNTEESDLELSSHEVIAVSLRGKIGLALEKIKQLDNDNNGDNVSRFSDTTRNSVHSHLSSASSVLLRKKAKAEAAKARLLYAEKEAKLKREEAEREDAIQQQKAEFVTSLEILAHEKVVTEAKAELAVMQEVIQDSPSKGNPDQSLPRSVADKHEYTKKYVEEHASRSHVEDELCNDLHIRNNVKDKKMGSVHCRQGAPDIPETSLDVKAPEFVPANQVAAEFTKFLLKKLLLKLIHFNDEPNTYQMWKTSFKGVASELQATPSEEMDLLVKWLGPQSTKYAISFRTANGNNPAKGLKRLWTRLDERFGSPEMVESSVKNKLAKFEKVSNKDYKKLFDLCDILSEIESLKEDDRYHSVLAYFDSSTGINPIVQKLPFSVQNKWTERASQYKKHHCVSFPPFTYFVEFIHTMSSTLNDPSFNCEVQGNVESSSTRGKGCTLNFKSSVSTKKTDVERQQTQRSVSEVRSKNIPYCPLHKSHHTLNTSRSFKHLPIIF